MKIETTYYPNFYQRYAPSAPDIDDLDHPINLNRIKIAKWCHTNYKEPKLMRKRLYI